MSIPTAISAASMAIGALGSFFGGGQKTNLPPEIQKIMDLLERRATEGLSTEEENLLSQQLNRRLGSEFGALSSLTQSRLSRLGAGIGVQEAAISALNRQRLSAIGEGTTNIGLMDQQAKTSALSQLNSFAGGVVPQFTRDTGQGFNQLFGFGLQGLLESQRRNRHQELLDAILGGSRPE